jgi:predicted DNA-binding transcriptional regulator YafY
MRASRLVAMLLLLQARGRMTAAELATELTVSVRTVQRDAEALAQAGVPVYSERGRDGGYRLVDGYRSRLTGLARDEAQALVAIGGSGLADELGLGQALMSARLKLAASLPARLRDEVAAAAGRFHLDAPGWFSTPRAVPFLETLACGVFGDVAIEARYRGRSGLRDCLLEPLGLVLKGGTWYLVAREGAAVRGYRADRFEYAEASDRAFTRPAGFDLAAFWSGWRGEFEHGLACVTVTVRARPGCIRRLRRVVEPTRIGEVCWDAPPGDDGWVRLQLPFEKLEYAWAALLGVGADVEVLAPQELRTQMARTAAALSLLYAGGPVPADAVSAGPPGPVTPGRPG